MSLRAPLGSIQRYQEGVEMKPILTVVPYGENITERRPEPERIRQTLERLQDELRQLGLQWKDVSLLYIANSRDSANHAGQNDFDQMLCGVLTAVCDEQGWYPSLVGSTVFSSFYSHRGTVVEDIDNGLLLIAFCSGALDRIPVARDISSSVEDRRFAARNVLSRVKEVARNELQEELGMDVSGTTVAESSVGLLLTSGSGHIDQQETIDFKECYAVGQELLNEARTETGALKGNIEIIGGCASNRNTGLLQALYFSTTVGTKTQYRCTYSHGAVMALLPYIRGRYSLQHPYIHADVESLDIEFCEDDDDRYAENRYFTVRQINGRTPIEFLSNYWPFTVEELEKLADEHVAIPATPKAHLVTIASSLSRHHPDIWPNVPVWLERRGDEIVLRLVRAEDKESNYYLMELGQTLRQAVERLRPNAAALRKSFERTATDGDTLVSFLCESRKYVLNDQRSLAEADEMLRDLPPALTSIGIYLNGEYSTGQIESIGYHNYSQMGVMLPSRPLDDLPAFFRERSRGDYRLFICHAKRDRSLVDDIIAPISAELRSVDVWLDEDKLSTGVFLEEGIAAAINEPNRIILVFLSQTSFRSPWVQTEIGWAIDHESKSGGITVLPVTLDIDVLDQLDSVLPAEIAHYLLAKRIEPLSSYDKEGIAALSRRLSEAIRIVDAMNRGRTQTFNTFKDLST
jgi:TIR domain